MILQRRAERLRDLGRGAAHAHAVGVGRDDGQAARGERVLDGLDVGRTRAVLRQELVGLQPLVELGGMLVVLPCDQGLELVLVAQRQVDAEFHEVLGGRGGDRGLGVGVGERLQGRRDRGLGGDETAGAQAGGQ